MSVEQTVNPEEAQAFDKNQEVDINANVFSINDLDLENLNTKKSVAQRLTSPRTLEAMAALGLGPEEMEPVSYDSVKTFLIQRERSGDIPRELIDIRWKTLNQRRHDKKQLIMEERQKIIFQEQNQGFGGGFQSTSQLSNPNGFGSSIANPAFQQSAYNTMGSSVKSGMNNSQFQASGMQGGQFGTTAKVFPKFIQSQTSNAMRSSMYSGRAGSKIGGSQMGDKMNSTIGGTGPNKSSMLEQEMKAIRKIKEKQKKEIEQMIDYELKLNQIKAKNENNIRLQQEKELRQTAEVARKRKEQEIKKAQDEIYRQQKMEAEQAATKKRTTELLRREQDQKYKQEMLEISRLREMKLKEEMRKQKLAEQNAENERKQREAEIAAKQRQMEMQIREQERISYLEKQNKDRAQQSLVKRVAKEQKIMLAKDQADAAIMAQRQMFQRREWEQEQKRQMFEGQRAQERAEAKKQSKLKDEQLKQIFEESQKIEEMKKQKMLQNMAEADRRQKILADEQEKVIALKKLQSKEKQEYQVKIQENNKQLEEQKKLGLLSARAVKERQQADMTHQRDYEHRIKREQELLKREERLDNVARIARANKYQANKIKQKIDYDQLRGEQLMDEKKNMLDTRFAVRRQAEQQKRAMLETVEKMKKKGNFSKHDLKVLGLVDEEDEENEEAEQDEMPQEQQRPGNVPPIDMSKVDDSRNQGIQSAGMSIENQDDQAHPEVNGGPPAQSPPEQKKETKQFSMNQPNAAQ